MNVLPFKSLDGSTLVNISSDEILLVGGKKIEGAINDIYYYNFESSIWSKFSKLHSN